MSTGKAIGAIEFSSVGLGYSAQDEMLKAASVNQIIARTICSGKVPGRGGRVGKRRGGRGRGRLKVGSSAVIDELMIPNVHESVFPALGQSVVLQADEAGALGVVETFSGVSILAAADRAAKAARVTLFRIHVAMALGGKGLLLDDRQRVGRAGRGRCRGRRGPRSAACWYPKSCCRDRAGNCLRIICRSLLPVKTTCRSNR